MYMQIVEGLAHAVTGASVGTGAALRHRPRLNTSPIPHPAGVFDIDVDLIDHVVSVRTVSGSIERIRLEPRSVADFYAELMGALAAAGVPVTITERPSEVPNPIPFPDDETHAAYEPEFANRFWRALVSVDA
jgi:hypothetical protein